MSRAAAESGGVRASPNVWEHSEIYEAENRAFDPEQRVEAAIESLHPLAGADLLDIGCGAGFHLPRFADRGARVIGLEPHPPLAAVAAARMAGSGRPVAVLQGQAAQLPLRERSVDLVLARWAYFFGPGCEPGLAQVQRVIRPGGVAAFVDNDATRSTFGGWFAAANPGYDAQAVERFWRRAGFTAIPITTSWDCRDRDDFEAIVRIEFAAVAAERILAHHDGHTVDYAVNLWWRRY